MAAGRFLSQEETAAICHLAYLHSHLKIPNPALRAAERWRPYVTSFSALRVPFMPDPSGPTRLLCWLKHSKQSNKFMINKIVLLFDIYFSFQYCILWGFIQSHFTWLMLSGAVMSARDLLKQQNVEGHTERRVRVRRVRVRRVRRVRG